MNLQDKLKGGLPWCPFCAHRPMAPMSDPDADMNNVTVYCINPDCPIRYRHMRLEQWCTRGPHEMLIGHIPPDEPIFVLRAQDKHAPGTVEHWQMLNVGGLAINEEALQLLCPQEKWDAAAQDLQVICDWQREHPERVKQPD